MDLRPCPRHPPDNLRYDAGTAAGGQREASAHENHGRQPREKLMIRSQSIRLFAAVAFMALGLTSTSLLRAAGSPPEMSPDGLRLVKNTSAGVIYVRPGANFGKYDKLAILNCLVEFDANWQSNYNAQQVDPASFVSAADMNRIKTQLAADFKRIFVQELQAKGAYTIVDNAAPDVLVLRPAILNLRVTQPDLMTPDMSMTLVRSAGSMTMYLELWDSMTNTLLARAINAQADQGFGGQVADSVTNTAAADCILRQWADTLRNSLEAARAKSGG